MGIRSEKKPIVTGKIFFRGARSTKLLMRAAVGETPLC